MIEVVVNHIFSIFLIIWIAVGVYAMYRYSNSFGANAIYVVPVGFIFLILEGCIFLYEKFNKWVYWRSQRELWLTAEYRRLLREKGFTLE